MANKPNFSLARAWTAYDRGSEDIELILIAPERVPYLHDEERGGCFQRSIPRG